MDNKDARDNQIAVLYRAGFTLEEIGQRYGITRERVRKIVKSKGLSSKDGGKRIRAKNRAKKREDARERRCQQKYGCSYKEYLQIRDAGGIRPYYQQKNNAELRGIEWQFDLKTWWDVWKASKRWNKRGRRAGQYVMSRKGDKGPYSKENVEIILASKNITDGYKHRAKAEREQNDRPKHSRTTPASGKRRCTGSQMAGLRGAGDADTC